MTNIFWGGGPCDRIEEEEAPMDDRWPLWLSVWFIIASSAILWLAFGTAVWYLW